MTAKTELCRLMELHGSDKSTWHNYTPAYYASFAGKRTLDLKLFEMGLGTNNPDIPANMGTAGKPGASLRAWRDFFPNAWIYGADIDRNVLFQEDRITTRYCDQTKPADIVMLWSDIAPEDEVFDIMIDDGLHTLDANRTLLTHSLQKLKKTGLYIIEDIMISQIPNYVVGIGELAESLRFTFSIQQFSHHNMIDNAVCWIKRHQ